MKRRMGRQSLVHSGIILAIAASEADLARLSRNRSHPSLLPGGHLRLRGPCLNASTTAVVTHASHVAIHNYSAIDVGIVDDSGVYAHHGGVIAEHTS